MRMRESTVRLAAPGIACCVHDVCIAGQGAVDALDCSDANVQRIQESSYDQSCDAGTDCTAVFEGDLCGGPSGCFCNAAINTGALPQYQADVARTNAGRCVSPAAGSAACRAARMARTSWPEAANEHGGSDGWAPTVERIARKRGRSLPSAAIVP